MLITSANFPGAKFGPAGAAFAQRYRTRFGRGPGTWGAFGYEAMALALDAINRAGGPTPDHRAAIAQALFATRDRDSVLGRYSIDADGDTTLRRFGVYKVRARRPAFAFSLDSAGG